MGLMDLAHSMIEFADNFTQAQGVQATVQHESFISGGGAGSSTHMPPVARPAIVEYKQREVRTSSGEVAMSASTVTFLDPTVEVDINDRITLPNGESGPILALGAFVDSTQKPILTEVYLG
jgi:hypothetical protein